jgi:hypothetical protein
MAAQFIVGSVVEARGWHRDRPTAFWKLFDNLAEALEHGWVGYLASWAAIALNLASWSEIKRELTAELGVTQLGLPGPLPASPGLAKKVRRHGGKLPW